MSCPVAWWPISWKGGPAIAPLKQVLFKADIASETRKTRRNRMTDGRTYGTLTKATSGTAESHRLH